MVYISILAATLLAGVVQGVTGFGAGIITMMFFSHFFSIPLSAGLTGAYGVVFCASMVFRYRKEVNIAMAILPTLLYNLVSSFTINYAVMMDQVRIKKVLGVFLIVLSIYYLFISKSVQNRKLGLGLSLVFIAISGACDGLFSIGGPLMVLYFMSMTNSNRAYLGTMQLFFCVNSIYNTAFRFYKGILQPEHLVFVLVSVAGVLAGGAIGGKVVDKLDVATMRKLIYIMIGVSGVINLLG